MNSVFFFFLVFIHMKLSYYFLKFLKKSHSIYHGLKQEVIKARTWQEITSIISESDKNRDFTLENRDIEGLLFRLKFVETLNVNEHMLRKELKEDNGSLNKFVKFVREALENGSTENDMISMKPLDVLLQEIKSKNSKINTGFPF